MITAEQTLMSIYDELIAEFRKLEKTDYNLVKRQGYQDALWDIKIIANEKYAIELPKAENSNEIYDQLKCGCGHERKLHLPTTSINYTGGRCRKCTCKNFMTIHDYS